MRNLLWLDVLSLSALSEWSLSLVSILVILVSIGMILVTILVILS